MITWRGIQWKIMMEEDIKMENDALIRTLKKVKFQWFLAKIWSFFKWNFINKCHDSCCSMASLWHGKTVKEKVMKETEGQEGDSERVERKVMGTEW